MALGRTIRYTSSGVFPRNLFESEKYLLSVRDLTFFVLRYRSIKNLLSLAAGCKSSSDATLARDPGSLP